MTKHYRPKSDPFNNQVELERMTTPNQRKRHHLLRSVTTDREHPRRAHLIGQNQHPQRWSNELTSDEVGNKTMGKTIRRQPGVSRESVRRGAARREGSSWYESLIVNNQLEHTIANWNVPFKRTSETAPPGTVPASAPKARTMVKVL